MSDRDPTYAEYVTASVARTKRAIRALGLSVSCIDGEWRVSLPGRDQEGSAYYTGDNADAFHTAHSMAAHWRSCQHKGGAS